MAKIGIAPCGNCGKPSMIIEGKRLEPYAASGYRHDNPHRSHGTGE